MEASNLGTPSKRITILLHAVHDCSGGKIAAIAAQITCIRIERRKLM